MRRTILCACAMAVFGLASAALAEEGLMGYWNFDADSAEKVADLSGMGNDGKLEGNAKLVANGAGRALELDGTLSSVIVPHSECLNLAERGTVSVWVLFASYEKEPVAPALIQKGSGVGWVAGGYHLFVHLENKSVYGAVYNGQGGGETYDGVSLGMPAAGEWHHLAYTWDGANVRGYVDGKSVATQPQRVKLWVNNQPLWIGRSATGSIRGRMDEVKLYDRALAEAEIAAEFERTRGGMSAAGK